MMYKPPAHMVVVLACSKKKVNASQAQAGELYLGSIFTKGKDIAERAGIPFWILSAKYGFLRHDQVISTYDQKFKKPFLGPFPGRPWHGFYLGGQLYFKNMPQSFQPLVPSMQMGYMLQALTKLQNEPETVRQMIEEHPYAHVQDNT